jgi:hypothetical protein
MIEAVGEVDPGVLAELEGFVGSQRTLEDVTRWALFARPPKLIVSVIEQYEFTSDMVVRYAERAYLVYDST